MSEPTMPVYFREPLLSTFANMVHPACTQKAEAYAPQEAFELFRRLC
jgi:hypothetical protein